MSTIEQLVSNMEHFEYGSEPYNMWRKRIIEHVTPVDNERDAKIIQATINACRSVVAPSDYSSLFRLTMITPQLVFNIQKKVDK